MEKTDKLFTLLLKISLTLAIILIALSCYNFSQNGRYVLTTTQYTDTVDGADYIYVVIATTDTQTGKTLVQVLDGNTMTGISNLNSGTRDLFITEPNKGFSIIKKTETK